MAWRVASERMYTLGLLIAFIRMRSPSRAPPVFRLEGSTEIIASVLSFTSMRKRRTSSSTRDDFPAPPVPVMPNTGALLPEVSFLSSSTKDWVPSGSFSATVIAEAIPLISFAGMACNSFVIFFTVIKSVCCSMSLIIPCRPIFRPSSGEYMREIPYSCNSAISEGRITPPPPPKILIWPAPRSCSRSYMYLKYSICPPW
ncbi:hypothetical protein D9M68_684490 [compost metagenome]